MKKILIILSMTITCTIQNVHAQTWEEWFKQKKTQKKYLIEQIAALKVFMANLKKGIDIAHNGWNTIHNIKDGNFNLHRDFFSSLKKVNPHISNAARVADIIAFQLYITRDLKRLTGFCKSNDQFTPEEVRYVLHVYTNMLFLCDANLAELLMIIRSEEATMNDNERMRRIDNIYADMQDKRAFVKEFENDTQTLAQERAREQRMIVVIKGNYQSL